MQAVTQLRRRLPVVVLPAPPVTVSALDGVEADDGRVELLDGLCVLRPWPTPLRTRVIERLAERLAAAATSGAHVHPQGVGVQISPRTLLYPDIVVGPAPGAPAIPSPPTEEQQPAQPPAPARTRLAELPFLVVEVADETTRRYDRTLKLDIYRERGVPSCWLVDPNPTTASVEVYDLVDGDYQRTGAARGTEELSVTRPFPVTVVPADLVDPPD
ncbi:MAG: Uma2 family endonuclease [Frankia sp.]|nr:Uma2 family endonuclease [Frankia sp.]